jgi:hypothetical protein
MKTATAVALSIGAVLAVPIVYGALSIWSAPSRVLTRTLDTDNIIHNYEWFHDMNGRFRARISQIAAHKKYLEAETHFPEIQRLRIELAGMQQSCRDIATQYNANAVKTNRNIFMGKEAPYNLPERACE